MRKEHIKQKLEGALNYLDATLGITDSDNTNIDSVKDLLCEVLEELEDELNPPHKYN